MVHVPERDVHDDIVIDHRGHMMHITVCRYRMCREIKWLAHSGVRSHGGFMKKYIALFAAGILMLGCGASSKPELKTKINSMFSASSSKDFGKSARYTAAMPYAVGQYVVHGVTEGNKKSVTRTSIVGKEKDGWVFEFYSLSESQEGTVQMLVTGFGKAAKEVKPDALEIKWIKIKDEKGQVQTFEGPMLSMMKSLYKNSLNSLESNDTTYTDGGSVTVPAGVFSGTMKFISKVKTLGKTFKSTGYVHSAVPINGIVKSVSDQDAFTMELLSFGTSGAVSSFK